MTLPTTPPFPRGKPRRDLNGVRLAVTASSRRARQRRALGVARWACPRLRYKPDTVEKCLYSQPPSGVDGYPAHPLSCPAMRDLPKRVQDSRAAPILIFRSLIEDGLIEPDDVNRRMECGSGSGS